MLSFGSVAGAQDYPAKPVKIITQGAAGSGPDVIARLVAEELGRHWRQQVVIVNQPGGGGVMAARAASEADPDIKANIRSQTGMRGLGGPVLGDDDDTDEFDKDHSAARLLKARAEKAELELVRMKGGTEEEVKLRLIEMVFQRHSPHALTGRFRGNGWLDLKGGPSCARASSLILARNCEVMRQMATVVEQAIGGNLEPVNGRRDLLVPWEPHRLEWAKEVGDVFQSEIDDRALLVDRRAAH